MSTTPSMRARDAGTRACDARALAGPDGPVSPDGDQAPGSLLLASSLNRTDRRRRLSDRMVTIGVHLAFGIAMVPLVSLTWMVITRGAQRFGLDFLTTTMRGYTESTGGVYHAIIGTVEVTVLAAVFSVPLGIITAVMLALARVMGETALLLITIACPRPSTSTPSRGAWRPCRPWSTTSTPALTPPPQPATKDPSRRAIA